MNKLHAITDQMHGLVRLTDQGASRQNSVTLTLAVIKCPCTGTQKVFLDNESHAVDNHMKDTFKS